jgi:hypothetical protein
MRIFGIAIPLFVVLIIFFWLGTKFPNTFRGLPVVG